jgi:hypothetical protein
MLNFAYYAPVTGGCFTDMLDMLGKAGVWLAASGILMLLVACESDNKAATPVTPAPEGQAQAQSPSLEEYFAQVSAGFDRLSAAAEDSAEPATIDELLPTLKDSLTQYSAAMTAFADEMMRVSAPAAVAVEHAAFREALRKDAQATSELAEELGGAQTLSQATEVLESRNSTLLESREPCDALQGIADREGISVTLPCDE